MKIIVIIIAIILIATFVSVRMNSKPRPQKKAELVSLDSISSSGGYMPIVSGSWLDETREKYSGVPYDVYDNTFYALTDILVNKVYQDYKYWDKGLTHAQFINQLSRAQKLYFALVNFEGQVNNGGVYQFLFNQPELSLIVLDAMKEARLEKLYADYKIVLEEYLGTFDSIQQLQAKFQEPNKSWNKRWNAFVSGYKQVPSALKIEDYFYTEEYKKEFHQKMVDFVLTHQDELFIVKE